MTYIIRQLKHALRMPSLAGCALLCLHACSTHPVAQNELPAIEILQQETLMFGQPRFIAYPRPDHFSICYGNTCAAVAQLSLQAAQWSRISELFSADQNSEQEQQAIRTAVARLERFSGELTGTDQDRGRNLPGWGLSGQMDCIDESTNTTVYLSMLQSQGLLRWHSLDSRVSRGISAWQPPHFTAVIRHTGTQKKYAVDSWFLDNGQPPFVIPLKDWMNGWEPDA